MSERERASIQVLPVGNQANVRAHRVPDAVNEDGRVRAILDQLGMGAQARGNLARYLGSATSFLKTVLRDMRVLNLRCQGFDVRPGRRRVRAKAICYPSSRSQVSGLDRMSNDFGQDEVWHALNHL